MFSTKFEYFILYVFDELCAQPLLHLLHILLSMSQRQVMFHYHTTIMANCYMNIHIVWLKIHSTDYGII